MQEFNINQNLPKARRRLPISKYPMQLHENQYVGPRMLLSRARENVND